MRTGRPKQPLILTEEERDNQTVAKQAALLAGHGGQVALPVSEGAPGRAL